MAKKHTQELHQMLGLPRESLEVRLREMQTTAEVILADPNPVRAFNRACCEYASANKASIAEDAEDTEDTKEFDDVA